MNRHQRSTFNQVSPRPRRNFFSMQFYVLVLESLYTKQPIKAVTNFSPQVPGFQEEVKPIKEGHILFDISTTNRSGLHLPLQVLGVLCNCSDGQNTAKMMLCQFPDRDFKKLATSAFISWNIHSGGNQHPGRSLDYPETHHAIRKSQASYVEKETVSHLGHTHPGTQHATEEAILEIPAPAYVTWRKVKEAS